MTSSASLTPRHAQQQLETSASLLPLASAEYPVHIQYWCDHEDEKTARMKSVVAVDGILSVEEIVSYLLGDGVPVHLLHSLLVLDVTDEKFKLVQPRQENDAKREFPVVAPLSYSAPPSTSSSDPVFDLRRRSKHSSSSRGGSRPKKPFVLPVILQFDENVVSTSCSLTMSLTGVRSALEVERVDGMHSDDVWTSVRVFDPILGGFVSVRESFFFDLHSGTLTQTRDDEDPFPDDDDRKKASLHAPAGPEFAAVSRQASFSKHFVIVRFETYVVTRPSRESYDMMSNATDTVPHHKDQQLLKPARTFSVPVVHSSDRIESMENNEFEVIDSSFVDVSLADVAAPDSSQNDYDPSSPLSSLRKNASNSLKPSEFSSDPSQVVSRSKSEPWTHVETPILTMCSRYVDYARFSSMAAFETEKYAADRDSRWLKVHVPSNPADISVKLKQLIRFGVPPNRRHEVWNCVSGGTMLREHRPTMIDRISQKVWGGIFDSEASQKVPRVFPEFGGELILHEHLLNPSGNAAVKRLLCMLSAQFPAYDHCPMLPDTVCLLLLFLREDEVYYASCSLIQKSIDAQWYFRASLHHHRVFVIGFSRLLRSRSADLMNHLESIRFDLNQTVSRWFERLFVSYVPFSLSLRIFDAFLGEGNKVLYRYALSFFMEMRPTLLKLKDAVAIESHISSFLLGLGSREVDTLTERAFKFSLSRSEMRILDESLSVELPVLSRKEAKQKSQFVYYRQVLNTPTSIASEENLEILWSWLPSRLQIRDLDLVYSSSRDGYSLQTLYCRCEEANFGPTLLFLEICSRDDLVHAFSGIGLDDMDSGGMNLDQNSPPLTSSSLAAVEDGRNSFDGPRVRSLVKNEGNKIRYVIGAFLPESLQRTFQYSGTGETFVFRLAPNEAVYRWAKHLDKDSSSVLQTQNSSSSSSSSTSRTQSSSSASGSMRGNEYFVLGSNDGIQIGGGGDGPAIRMDARLSSGASYTSDTFLNEPLFTDGSHFEILQIEMYKFV